MEGDKFEIKQDKDGDWYVYINDIPLDEPYILSKKDCHCLNHIPYQNYMEAK